LKVADRVNSIFPDWYNDFITIASSIGLAFAMVKWFYKKRISVKKLVLPAYFVTLVAIMLFFQPSIGSTAYPFIAGRVTSVWGPSGPPPPNSGSNLNLALVVLVWVGGIAIVTVQDLAKFFQARRK